MRKLAIIPVFKSEDRFSSLLGAINKKFVDAVFIVVDEPAPEILATINQAKKQKQMPELVLVTRPKRGGIGSAIILGIKYALSNNYDIIIVMAGNGKDDPKEIPLLTEPIIKEDYDYVQGSRFLKGGSYQNLPFMRRLITKFYPLLWSFLTRKKCTEVTNGFRAYKSEIFNKGVLDIDQTWLSGYQLEYYIHFKALTHFKTKEVPVSKTYPQKGSYTKINVFKNFWEILSPLVYLSLGLKK